jgi:hypothetical protein
MICFDRIPCRNAVSQSGRAKVCPRRILLLLVPVLVCALYFPWRKTAGDDWPPIDPAELKMTSEPKAPGAPEIYLYRQFDRKETGRGNHTEVNCVRLKILTEEGRKYANVEIPNWKSVGGINGIQARTVHPGGSIVNFDGKVFENAIVNSSTLKYLAKTFTVPDVQVGSVIEYRYVYDLEDFYLFRSNRLVDEDLFAKRAVFSLKPYKKYDSQWSMPAGLPAGTEPPKAGPDAVIRIVPSMSLPS